MRGDLETCWILVPNWGHDNPRVTAFTDDILISEVGGEVHGDTGDLICLILYRSIEYWAKENIRQDKPILEFTMKHLISYDMKYLRLQL